MSTITQDRLLTVKEAAYLVGMSKVSLDRRIDRGDLPVIRLGDGPKAPVRVYLPDLEDFAAPVVRPRMVRP